MKIYVGNLPYTVTEDDLTEVFNDFGDVDKVNIVLDQETGESKGFGFIEMPSSEDANDAIKALDDSALQGRNIKVHRAKAKRSFKRKRNTNRTTENTSSDSSPPAS